MDVMVVINQMLQLFIIIGLGYFMQKKKILNDEINSKLNYIVISITTPAMIFSSVCTTTIDDKNMVIYTLIVATAVYIALPIISFLLVKIMRIPMRQKGLYMFMTIFSNIGFMGFPIMKALFGNDAVFYTALFNILFNLEVFTLGVILINYGNNVRMKLDPKNLLSPGVVSSIIAVFIYFLEIPIPGVLANCFEMVGDMTTPLAMMIIGATLANIELKSLFTELRLYYFTVVKQVILPIVVFPIIAFFIRDPLIQGITLVNIAMPVGNSAVLFAKQYGGDVELAAKSIFITTLVSVFTIPLVISILLV
ncbi:AEC family transporter [uncultured Thomasclavelia sp.]|uniref:AEC family transporter n=1 Tax=uncultured Thomasclavelia sp. TaxID=3025759 RepID=UPI0025DFD982|nr:AEC family transporter [uncultured Thomasclavelia sp.]